MFEVFHPGDSLAWDYLWQSTLFLGLGLVASILLAKRPARAHRFLLLAMFAALVSPILTQAVRRTGWGLLTPGTDHANGATVGSPAIAAPPSVRALLHSVAITPLPASQPVSPVTIARSHGVDLPDSVGRLVESAGQPRAGLVPIAWRTFVLGVWAALAVLAGLRLVIGVILGMNVIRRAPLIKNETLEATAASAATRLGVEQTPELRVSPQVRCPAIWCWARRPVIVLPENEVTTAASVDWAGIFCHELAHWVRYDHWSSLLAEVLVCSLPWHPLVWWARHRLGQLSERASDDWVLAAGLPAGGYADSLLSLIPQRRGVLAMSALSSQRALPRRIRHILAERHSSPMVGSCWAWVSAVAMILVTSAVALGQSRPPVKNQSSQLQDDARYSGTSKVSAATPNVKATRHSVSGTVLGPDGRPVSGAAVVWIGHRKPPLPHRALPEDQKARPAIGAEVLGEARTDTSGRFSLAAEFDPDRYEHDNGFDANLLVRAPGLGMLSRLVKVGVTEVALRLAPEVVIRGRLVAPSGVPAAGVRVTLKHFFNDDHTEGMGVGVTPTDDSVPHYWPKPRTTDTDGRFTLEGVPPGMYVQLDFWHADYAVDEVVVDTSGEGVTKAAQSDWAKAFEVTPVKPAFTHTLEPARPVQGRVTDKQTGRPLAGILIHMIPMRRHGGMPFYARTDADGRYGVSGHSAEHYWITVYPPADSGYIAVQDKSRSWPAGAKFLERDFALDKGRIVHGRVIDAETKRAIAGAAVCYQPQRKNPNNREGFEHRSTILTDNEGRFAITTLAGQGFLVVETSDDTYLRVPFPEKADRDAESPRGAVPIDVPDDREPKPVEFALSKGAILKARVVDPDGNAVTDVVASCEEINQMELLHAWQPAEKGIFQLSGADSSRTYRIFFIQPDRQLGAVVELKPDPRLKQPVEVVLQPTAKVHGKVVTENGSPAEGAQVNPMIVMGNPKKGEMTRAEIMLDAKIYANLMGQKAIMSYVTRVLQPKPKGEFVIDTLVPGGTFYIMAGVGRREAFVSVPPLKPGEDRDLGTITLSRRKP